MKRTKRFREGLPSEPWPMIHVPLTTGSQRPTSQLRSPFEDSERLICIPFIKSWGKWPSMGINMPCHPNQAPLFIYSTTQAAGDKPLMIQHPVWKYGSFIQREQRRTKEGDSQKGGVGALNESTKRQNIKLCNNMEHQEIKGQDTDLPRCHLCEVLIQVAKPLLMLIAYLRWDVWRKCTHNCRSQAGTAHWLKWPLRHIANQPSLKLPLNGLP